MKLATTTEKESLRFYHGLYFIYVFLLKFLHVKWKNSYLTGFCPCITQDNGLHNLTESHFWATICMLVIYVGFEANSLDILYTEYCSGYGQYNEIKTSKVTSHMKLIESRVLSVSKRIVPNGCCMLNKKAFLFRSHA